MPVPGKRGYNRMEKLTAIQVLEIRERRKTMKRGEAKKIAQEFNVCTETIRRIINNRTWKDL